MLSTTQTSYDKITKTFSVDASLVFHLGENAWCVESGKTVIHLFSHKTGTVKDFVESSMKFDKEGEVVYHEFLPMCPKLRAEGVKMRVYND